jgi:hypothetical protein
MPLLDNNLFVLFRKFLRSCEVPNLHPGRLPELDQILYVENRFTVTLSDVDVNWLVIIAVKNKSESFLFKNKRHGKLKPAPLRKGDYFLPNVRDHRKLPVA